MNSARTVEKKVPSKITLNEEELAIMLACGADPDLAKQHQITEAWYDKEEQHRHAYRNRARRLMRTWSEP